MKLNSSKDSVTGYEGLQSFSPNFSIYTLVREVIKKPQTVHNGSQTTLPKIQKIDKKDVQPGIKKNIWCSINCPDGERREVDGLPVLFCQGADRAVIDLDRCPAGHWIKDAKGRPCNVA